MPIQKSINYVVIKGEGHHSDFDRLFMAVFQKEGINVALTSNPWHCLFNKAPLFYSMFDRRPHQTLSALALAFLRSLWGLRTIGIFFRPADCFITGSIKAKLRRFLFNMISKHKQVRLLTIVPFDVYPQGSEVATNWIYDPQLWDLPFLGKSSRSDLTSLTNLLNDKANGRKIIVALGRQNRGKGFDYFVDVWASSPELRKKYLFVSAGKVASLSLSQAVKLEENGGLLLNRRIEEAELMYLYERCAAVWCCYAPDYDQSSGIHGRAVQLGLPVIVRHGSAIEKLSRLLFHPTLAINFDDTECAATGILEMSLHPMTNEKRESQSSLIRHKSLAVLREALNV